MSWLDDYNDRAPVTAARRPAPRTSSGGSWLDNYNARSAAGDPNSFFAPGDMDMRQPRAGVMPSSLIPRNLETAGRMGGAMGGGALGLTAPQMPQQGFMGMSEAELLQFLLGSGGGGGAPDLSGYNDMLSDISGREATLGTRRGEQEAFLNSLFEAAQSRMATDQEGLAAAVQSALESDQARRATEIELIRGKDAERLALSNAAREAAGVEGGPSLVNELAQNAVAGVGASGSVSERDARIRESIERQQLQSQIAGLTPMQQMANTSLSRGYEDRLSALAGERAAIKAQMAQARSAPRGGGGPSVNEKLAALGFVSGLNAPAEAPQFGGSLGSAQQIQQYFGPEGSNVLGIANRILTGADLSRFDPTSLAGASELLTRLSTSDPEVQSFLNRNPEAPGAIIQYIVQSSK